jgi:hypothetical protein
MINKVITYYEIEWTDAEGNFHADYYVPSETPLMSTTFYHKCDDPRADALAFMNKLIKYNLFPFKMDMKETTVKVVE